MTKTKRRGMLITFEGGEGAGKTTQVALLQEKLEAEGWVITVAREPGGTTVGEQIRAVILNVENQSMTDLTEVLLYQAARAQVYTEVIRPALRRGEIVLMDRSGDSSVVYQGIVRGMGMSLIEKLNRISMAGLKPDHTFLLDIPVVTGFARKKDSKLDRLEQEGKKFHQAVREGYLQLLKRPGNKRFHLLDARVSIGQIQKQVWQICEPALKRIK